MTIDELYRFVVFLSNKTQSGGIKISDFNLAADRAQMQLFERDFRHWKQTKEITDTLAIFLKTVPLVVTTSGTVNYPADWEHTASIRHYYVDAKGGREVPVETLNNDEWGDMLTSEVAPPTDRYPKLTEYDTYMQVMPRNIGQIILDYFRRPVAPVWGFTTSASGRPVYDATTSTQPEFPDYTMNEIAAIMCGLLGISLREGQLQQFAQMYKAENE